MGSGLLCETKFLPFALSPVLYERPYTKQETLGRASTAR